MFLSPLFLIAAGIGAAVPLILHLMQNRRRVTVPFPTLRFLKLAEKQSSRRIKMENLLLWLIRTLIMLLLGMAFAMPMLRSRGLGWLGDAPRDVAIVIDASFSMGYDSGRETTWDRAQAAATAILEGLGENDRFCLYIAREQPEALVAEPVGDKEEGISRIANLMPGRGSSQLAPAVTAAIKALGDKSGGRERELHILTDNQALPWESFGAGQAADAAAATAAWDPQVIDKRTTVFVSMLGVPKPENGTVLSVDLQPAVVRPGAGAQIIANLSASGDATATTATLFVDEEQIARRSLDLGSPDASAPTFSLPPLPPGSHPARIETPDDHLTIDNAFHFLIRVEDQMPSLCVGSQQDTLFVRTALRVSSAPGSTPPTAILPGAIASQTLGKFACVFLCNALPVSGQELAALEGYVRGGGLLVIFPGLAAPPDAYKTWTCLPGFPSAIEEIPFSRRRRTLTWDKPQHPLLRPLREGIGDPAVTVLRCLRWDELHPSTERLVSMGADQPFLLERPFGDGRVLMLAVSADRGWSDFPLSPFYLPLVSQCVDYTFGFGSRSPFIWATDSLSLTERLPEAGRGSTLVGPDKKPVPLRSTVADGRTFLTAEDLTLPGIYSLKTTEQPRARAAIAVNLQRRESDLTPIPPADARSRLGAERLLVVTDQDGLLRAIGEHRIGRTYGEHLLWLALLLVGVEFCYANALLRAKPRRLSDDLGVDASGKITGKPSRAGQPAS